MQPLKEKKTKLRLFKKTVLILTNVSVYVDFSCSSLKHITEERNE